ALVSAGAASTGSSHGGVCEAASSTAIAPALTAAAGCGVVCSTTASACFSNASIGGKGERYATRTSAILNASYGRLASLTSAAACTSIWYRRLKLARFTLAANGTARVFSSSVRV